MIKAMTLQVPLLPILRLFIFHLMLKQKQNNKTHHISSYTSSLYSFRFSPLSHELLCSILRYHSHPLLQPSATSYFSPPIIYCTIFFFYIRVFKHSIAVASDIPSGTLDTTLSHLPLSSSHAVHNPVFNIRLQSPQQTILLQ